MGMVGSMRLQLTPSLTPCLTHALRPCQAPPQSTLGAAIRNRGTRRKAFVTSPVYVLHSEGIQPELQVVNDPRSKGTDQCQWSWFCRPPIFTVRLRGAAKTKVHRFVSLATTAHCREQSKRGKTSRAL